MNIVLHQTPDTNKCYFKEETFVTGERPLGLQRTQEAEPYFCCLSGDSNL